MMLRLIFLLVVLPLPVGGRACCAAVEADGPEIALQSPHGQVSLKLSVVAGQELRYSVERAGRLVIEPSPIVVHLAGRGSPAAGAKVQRVERRDIDESSELLWGKASRIRDHCREARVQLRSPGGIEWIVELRAYDDGVAFRYIFPDQEELRELVIEDETTEFRLDGDPHVLFTMCENFTTSHEALYDRKLLSQLAAKTLIDKPLLAVWPDGSAAAITEAGLRQFAGMYLERPEDARNTLRTRLSLLPDHPNAAVVAKAPHSSPWRVVLLAEQAGKLIDSNLLLCLNDPPEGDFNWLKPGKTTWPWWNGTVEHGPPSTPEHNLAIHKTYIDFCARNNIAYHSVVSVAEARPWYTQSGPPGFVPRPDTDVLTPRPDLDLPAILAYAKEKGVGIRLWVWWTPLSQKLDEAFATYERWGVKGLMVDFMDRDDQEMVEWQERCLQAAARHKLHIQFHGSYKPTGEQRTYPHLFNREGVLNLEYLKWSDSCAPPHNVNVAYTRLLAGPLDYHLGGFRSVSRRDFYGRDELPFVLGTRCHHLAMYVVYENPMPMVCDVPSAYEGQPGFDFIVDVPVTWDQTRFIAGEAGEYVVLARRSGDTWYLGGMTNWSGRELRLPLDFLGEGEFTASLYLDGSPDGDSPNEVRQEQQSVTAASILDLPLASGGGVVAVIRPR